MTRPMPAREGDARVWRDRDQRRHREDGPAVEFDSGGKWWFREGIMTASEFGGIKRRHHPPYVPMIDPPGGGP